jgi:hypothetical protein
MGLSCGGYHSGQFEKTLRGIHPALGGKIEPVSKPSFPRRQESSLLKTVIPAQAGIESHSFNRTRLDPRRREDDIESFETGSSGATWLIPTLAPAPQD